MLLPVAGTPASTTRTGTNAGGVASRRRSSRRHA